MRLVQHGHHTLGRLALSFALLGVACDGATTIPGDDADAGIALDLAAGGDDGPRAPDLSADPGDGPIVARDLSGGGDAGGGCIAGLQAITLAPGAQMVKLDGKIAAPLSFTAQGTMAGGVMKALDVAALKWSVARADDTPPGTIDRGKLAPFPSAGGVVTVTATDGCVSGSATVTFTIEVAVGPVPVDPGPWAVMPQSGAGAPTIVYPSNETRFPRNIYRTLFQWRTAGLSKFRLTFEGGGNKVVVYSDGVHALCANKNPAAGCWEANEEAWQFIAGSNAGGTVTLTLDALDESAMPAKVRRAAPITLGFSKRDVAGAIFYWSTTSAGIRRAAVGAAEPEDYITGKPGTVYPDPEGEVGCVACHTVSRDGKYMVAPVQAGTKSLWIMEVTRTAPPKPLVTSIAGTGGHGFATISPDDSKVVSAFNGPLTMHDRATGMPLGVLPLGMFTSTHPDWSPDDTQLVFATAKGDSPGGAGLAVIPWNKPGWGAPRTIVPANGLTNLFPMFNPDGGFIAYARGRGGHGDKTAQLWVTDKEGKKPIELLNANRVVSNAMTAGQWANNQPTWAPQGDFEWVAFNSVREYGVVLPAGTQQIWVAAVDRARLAAGLVDPSYPAFRLQFQGLNENNHRAFWTLDVRDPQPVPDGGVPPDMSTPDMARVVDMAGDLARMCVPAGGKCDAVLDKCCDQNHFCDTMDNGLTYTCIPGIN